METLNKMNGQLTQGGKLFANHGADKPLVFRLDKEIKNYKTNTPVKKWAKNINQQFSNIEYKLQTDTWKST